MKFINVILSVLMSLLIGLLVFEGGLRLIGKGPPTTLTEFDPLQGWSNKAGQTITRGTVEGFDVTYGFNKYGMRDDAVSPEKPEDLTRVVALGDSFTLGLTVRRDYLFVDLIEKLWTAGQELEVLNTGTEAYSTDQQVAWLEANGAEWKPDIVLLFPYENDIYWNGQTDYVGTAKPRYSEDGTLEDRELTNTMERGWVGGSAIGRLFSGGQSAPTFTVNGAVLPKEFGVLLDEEPDFITEAVAHTRGSMLALARLCKELEAQGLVVPIPSHSCVDPEYRKTFETERLPALANLDWSPDRPVDIFLELAREAGLQTLDVRERFRAKTKDGVDLYFDKDWHLNEQGNVELASAVNEAGIELELISSTASETPPDLVAGPSPSPAWPRWYAGLLLVLGGIYSVTYRKVDPFPMGFLKVGALLAVIFTIAVGGMSLLATMSPQASSMILLLVILAILGFVLYKLGDRVGTISELLVAFVGRGHWYLMPLVTILLTIGSLLVVAASSPLVAPFIYTLF